MLFLRFLGSNPSLTDKGGVVIVSDQDGETRQISPEELNYFASMQYARRIFVYTLVNYCAGCVLTLSLPIFLAQSSDPIEFILNAVASTFIIQSIRAQRTLLICVHRWKPPRMRCRRLRTSTTDQKKPLGDLQAANRQDSTGAAVMAGPSISRY